MDRKDLEIFEVLVLSTAHITREDNKELEADAGKGDLFLNPAEDHYGYYIWTGFVEDRTPEDFKEAGFSEAVFNVLKFARDHNIMYVKLDCDGNTIDELETFEW